jgi:CO/xanthine dehydrogenase FAD-binding subunit
VSFGVYEPTSLREALSVLTAEGEAGAVLAGGTDLLLRIRRGARKYRSVVNLKFVPGLDGVLVHEHDGVTLGALTTFRTIEKQPTLQARYPALTDAARVVAGVQLRNLATVGGNLGNASPSADSVPPLVALGATIEIASAAGSRHLPVEASITGPGRTALEPGEVFTAIELPALPPRSGNAYIRFSPRSAMDIGIASVATSVTLGATGVCNSCRIALGAVSPLPLRATKAEALLMGERLTPSLAKRAGELAAEAAQPISDIRGSADYRRAMVRVLTTRTVELAASRAARAATY